MPPTSPAPQPHIARMARALARNAATDPQMRFMVGDIPLTDLDEVPAEFRTRGACALLGPARPGKLDGVVETNLARKGMFYAGIPRRRQSDEVVLRVLAGGDRLGTMSRIDTDGPSLTEVEFQVIMALCLAWRNLGNENAVVVPFTLSGLCRELGWDHNGGTDVRRVRQAISALRQAGFRGEVWDPVRRVKAEMEFSLIDAWQAISRSDRDSSMDDAAGVVHLSAWLVKQLRHGHVTYFPRYHLRRLRRPVAKILLPFLESERFDTPTRSWEVDRRLLNTVGIADSRIRQGRETLKKAAEDLLQVDEQIAREQGVPRRWLRVEVVPGETRLDNHLLVAERRLPDSGKSPVAPARVA